MFGHQDRTRSWLVTALALALGCGGSDGVTEPPPPPPPPARILTSLTLSASSTSLFSAAPGNTTTLTVTPRDQNGTVMSGLGTASFTSSNPSIATVSGAGLVTGVAGGGVEITASLTAGGVTRTGAVSLTVVVAPISASVTNQMATFTPAVVDISAGGTVSWTFGPVAHDVTFDQAGAPANIAAFASGSQSRSFPAGGSFSYQCTIHAGMTGTVRVH